MNEKLENLTEARTNVRAFSISAPLWGGWGCQTPSVPGASLRVSPASFNKGGEMKKKTAKSDKWLNMAKEIVGDLYTAELASALNTGHAQAAMGRIYRVKNNIVLCEVCENELTEEERESDIRDRYTDKPMCFACYTESRRD